MGEQGFVVKKNIQSAGLFQAAGPRLGRLDIELTERCNNNCQHCYINLPQKDEKAQARELSTVEWQNILKQAADLGALSIRITGGEPLLRPDFAEIYLYARRLGLSVYLFTNARLITPDLADLLARVPPLKKIEVSVYGMRPQSYDSVACFPGAFAEFRRGIDLLLARRIPFIVKSALLPPNRAEMAEFEAWAATLPGMERPPEYALFLDLRTRRDSPAKNRLITRLRISPEAGVAVPARGEELYRRQMADFCAKFMRPPGDRLFSCGAGEAGCVDAYGTIQMCMQLRHPKTVFDLKEGSLREAFTDFFPRLRELRAANPAYLERCARCFLKGLCEQCPARSWSEHGTLDTPVEYLCEVAHVQARYLGLLNGSERAWEVSSWQKRIEALSLKNIAGEVRNG